jgi:hypothetical protein
MKHTVDLVVQCDTVGDLLDALAQIAKDSHTSDLLDASIDGPNGEIFNRFKIVRRTLSDNSEVLDFELIEEDPGGDPEIVT